VEPNLPIEQQEPIFHRSGTLSAYIPPSGKRQEAYLWMCSTKADERITYLGMHGNDALAAALGDMTPNNDMPPDPVVGIHNVSQSHPGNFCCPQASIDRKQKFNFVTGWRVAGSGDMLKHPIDLHIVQNTGATNFLNAYNDLTYRWWRSRQIRLTRNKALNNFK